MGRYYILRDGEVIEEPDYEKWLAWFESAYQDVELIAESRLGASTVSTRFLALSMTLAQDSPPMVFETMVNGGWLVRACAITWVACASSVIFCPRTSTPTYPVPAIPTQIRIAINAI